MNEKLSWILRVGVLCLVLLGIGTPGLATPSAQPGQRTIKMEKPMNVVPHMKEVEQAIPSMDTEAPVAIETTSFGLG